MFTEFGFQACDVSNWKENGYGLELVAQRSRKGGTDSLKNRDILSRIEAGSGMPLTRKFMHSYRCLRRAAVLRFPSL